MVVEKPFGPHQFTTCPGLVIASHTSSRGASKVRVMTISRSAVPAASLFLLVSIFLLLDLHGLKVGIQAIEPLFPELAVLFDKIGSFVQRRRIELARPPLRLAAARDQPGALQHL